MRARRSAAVVAMLAGAWAGAAAAGAPAPEAPAEPSPSGAAREAPREAAPPAAPPAAAADADAEFGPPSGGLAAGLALAGPVQVGGRLVLRLTLRSAAGQAVALPSARDVFGWLLVAQSTPGSRKAVYSGKVYVARDDPRWPNELGGDRPHACPPMDVTAAAAYGSENARTLLTAYVAGGGDDALPAPAGTMGDALTAGRAMARFTLCLPVPGGKPTLVTTGGLEFVVGPPDLASLKPEAREAFVQELLRQFDRDAWSGQQAHDTAVRLGRDLAAAVIGAAAETSRPAHARLWLATTLCDLRDPRAVAACIQLLQDPMDGVRYVIAYHGPKQEDAALDRAIVEKVRTADGSRLAAWALLGFLVHRATVPEEVLKAGLESDDPRARATVAEALARHASEFNVARLASLLADRDERVRGTAAAVLGKSANRSPAILAALVKALDLPGDAARQRICRALGELTAQDIPYDPKADPAARDQAVAAWKAWWAKQAAGGP